jgi:thiol-disulfide isomerase/thioredoxin
MRCLTLSCCLLFFCAELAARAGTVPCPCEAPPEVRQELARLDFPNDAAMTGEERAAKRQAILSALLARYPDDIFVQARYQDLKHIGASDAELDSLVKEYQEKLAKHPDDPVSLYLYARTLVGLRTPEAEQYFEKALERAPDFARPHLDIARVHAYGRFRDLAKVQAHLEAFMKLCPSSLAPYGRLSVLEDKALLRQGLERLTKLLEGRSDDDAVVAHEALWDLEFHVAPTSEYAQARERVGADVARLRALGRSDSLKWFDALHRGYQLLGDEAGQKWVEGQLLDRFPQSSLTVRLRVMRWHQENPYPKDSSAADQLEAYNRARLRAADEWIRRWPAAPMPRSERYQAMTGLKDVPAADFEAAAEAFMDAYAKNRDAGATKPAPPLLVAQEYVKRGIELSSDPQLVESGLAQSLEQTHRDFRGDMNPPDDSRRFMTNESYSARSLAFEILTDAYLKMNQPAKAREVLYQAEKLLGEYKAERSATEGGMRAYLEGTYWEMMARVAEAQGRKLDALACYQEALAHPYQHFGPDKKGDDPAKAARQLWRSLGGTEEGWQAWIEQRAPTTTSAGEANWTKQDKPLPEFALADLEGRTWRLADLKGKVTFVNVWATSCGPCRAELPFVEKLYQQMKEAQDVLVLTLNTDQNPAVIEPFLRQNKYTFPVLPALSYLEHMDSALVVPQNWVVDRNGVLRSKSEGYGYNGEEWLKGATKTFEDIRAAQAGK